MIHQLVINKRGIRIVTAILSRYNLQYYQKCTFIIYYKKKVKMFVENVWKVKRFEECSESACSLNSGDIFRRIGE